MSRKGYGGESLDLAAGFVFLKNIVDKHLQFKIRIVATAFKNKKVKKAKISYIKQEGLFKPGSWGSANKAVPKIYILKYKEKIIYVGITKMPLSNRFRYGLSASGLGGYHGYAWKQLAARKESDPINLYIYLFGSEEWTEAIEAEIVYLIRYKTGNWPEHQTEIHFHQTTKAEKSMAEKIYKEIF
jgi:hypothetical protein